MNRPLPHILEKIRSTKEDEIRALLAGTNITKLEKQADLRLRNDVPLDFERAIGTLAAGRVVPNVIAEVKKASPSKGVIRDNFDPEEIAGGYLRAGAAAISCLTDEQYFMGHLEYIEHVKNASGLPVLRKDFIIHESQVLQACAAGADAILLIARMLDRQQLNDLFHLAKKKSLGVLVEIHDEPDLEKAMAIKPSLLGVNNRDLDTFTVDFENTLRLRKLIPTEISLVAESGISNHGQLLRLADEGISAVLVGESLMRNEDIETGLRNLIEG